MIDPSDRQLGVFQTGDERELPYPTGGVDGMIPDNSYQDGGGARGLTKMARSVKLTILANENTILKLDDRPDYWVVTCDNTASVVWQVWNGTGPNGSPDAWGTTGGSAKIPGTSESLYIEATGGTANLLVRAIRGYDPVENTYGSQAGGLTGVLPAALGQTTMANSLPVVIASNQSAVPVSGTVAATIADGADVTQGAIADAVIAAGAAGTIGAKLRAISRDLVANIVLAAGSAIIGKVGIDQTTPGTTDKVTAIGNAASGAADSGNPIKVGGKYNATAPTLADGNRGDIQIDSTGAQYVNTEGRKATYSAANAQSNPAASCTDHLTLTGSASKTIRVTRIVIAGIATAAGTFDVLLIKRSAANTGGTSAALTSVPHDSANSAASATPLLYSANPTVGTPVGTIAARKLVFTTAATPVAAQPIVFEFGERGQEIVLRGTSQVIAVNFNAVTITGGVVSTEITWTEE